MVSNSLRPHGLQHTRVPCPSSTPGACSSSCLLSRWCHPTISSSVVPFSLCLQSFPASGSFLMSQFFASGGQSIGVSASTSVFPMNIQDWFPLGLIGLNLLAVQGTLKSFLQHHSSKASILPRSAFFMVQLSHPYVTARKTIALTISIPHMEHLILCFPWLPTRLHEHWGQEFISLLLMATLLHAQSKAYFWLSEFTLVF